LEEAAFNTVAPRFRFGGMIFREKFCVDFSLIKKSKKRVKNTHVNTKNEQHAKPPGPRRAKKTH